MADIESEVVLGSCTLAQISALVVDIAAPEFLVKKKGPYIWYTALKHRSRSNTDHLLYVGFDNVLNQIRTFSHLSPIKSPRAMR